MHSLPSSFLVLTVFWAAIHAIYYLFKPSRAQSILPSNARFSRRNIWNSSSTQVILRNLHLRVQTTAWNLPHDLFASSLKRSHGLFLAQSLRRVYDLGSVLGVLGMLAAVGLLSLTTGMTALSLIHKIAAPNSPIPSSDALEDLTRRGFEPLDTQDFLREEPWIKPIVSGCPSLSGP